MEGIIVDRGCAANYEEFFDALLERWERSADLTGERVIVGAKLCGFKVRFNFASHRLARFLGRAFSFAAVTPACKWDFSIYAFDGSARVPLPSSPWRMEDYGPRGEIRVAPEIGMLVSFVVGPDVLNVYHSGRKEAVYWIRDGNNVPAFEQAAPFRSLIHWWLRDRGWMLVHGACVGEDGRGVLIAGKGGSGKSTLATVAAFHSGLQFCGDDYCAVSICPPFKVGTLYPTAKLTKKSRELLDREIKGPMDFDKVVTFISEEIPCQIPDVLDLQGIVVPRIIRGPLGRLMPIPGREMAGHLAVSTIFQMPHSGSKEFGWLARLARGVPGWILEVPVEAPWKGVPYLLEIVRSGVCS